MNNVFIPGVRDQMTDAGKAVGIDESKISAVDGKASRELRLNDPVALMPSRIVGRIARLGPRARGRRDDDAPAAAPGWMVVNTPLFQDHVWVSDTHRWRHVAGRETALAIMQHLVKMRPIPGWTLADGVTRGWTLPGAGAVHDLWADAGDERALIVGDVALSPCGMTALATLLDWAIEADSFGEVDGLWLGRLDEWRSTLLGELALSLNLAYRPLLVRLVAMRQETRPEDRFAPTAAAPHVDQPSATHAWSVPGAVCLGQLECPGALVMAENGWHINGVCREIETPLRIPTAPGTWTVVAVTREPPGWVARDEGAREVWQATSGRPWIVLAAQGRLPVAPSATVGRPDAASLDMLASQLDPWADDPLENLLLWAPHANGVPEALTLVGRMAVQGDGLVLLAGETLTPPIARALRQVGASWFEGVSLWPWGILHSGQHPAIIPVFAGGPADGRTYLAFPAPDL